MDEEFKNLEIPKPEKEILVDDNRFPNRVSVWANSTLLNYAKKNNLTLDNAKKFFQKQFFFANSVHTTERIKQISIDQTTNLYQENIQEIGRGTFNYSLRSHQEKFNNFFVKELSSHEDFFVEGKYMKNCIASYYDKAGRHFSIRNEKEEPIINLTLKTKEGILTLDECKGPTNQPLKEKDIFYLNQFLLWKEVKEIKCSIVDLPQDYLFFDAKTGIFKKDSEEYYTKVSKFSQFLQKNHQNKYSNILLGLSFFFNTFAFQIFTPSFQEKVNMSFTPSSISLIVIFLTLIALNFLFIVAASNKHKIDHFLKMSSLAFHGSAIIGMVLVFALNFYSPYEKVRGDDKSLYLVSQVSNEVLMKKDKTFIKVDDIKLEKRLSVWSELKKREDFLKNRCLFEKDKKQFVCYNVGSFHLDLIVKGDEKKQLAEFWNMEKIETVSFKYLKGFEEEKNLDNKTEQGIQEIIPSIK